MLHTKTFMFALITAGCLAAPTASAGYPPPPKYPHPDKHSCEDIKLKELEVDVKANGRVEATGTVKGLKKKTTEKAKITFKAEGEAEIKCMNNGGNFPKPHQLGSVDIKVSGWQKVEVEDGEAEFTILTDKPEAYGMCKHPFKRVVKDLEYDVVKVIVEHKECKVKFICELDPALGPNDSASLEDGIECYEGEVLES